MLIQKDVDLQKSELPEMCSFRNANYVYEFMSVVILNVYVNYIYWPLLVNSCYFSSNSQSTKPLA